MIDGALEENSTVWSQTISVSPNTDYVFSAWILTDNIGYIKFVINDVSSPDLTTPETRWTWEKYYMVWNSGNSTQATISIINRYAESGGYDYCLDDISFRQLTTVGNTQCTVYVETPDIPLPDNIDSANCVFFPTATEWGINVGWSSANIVSNLNIPLVGDLDNDGHPEIICFSMEGESPNNPNTDNQILVFDGVTKQLKTTITMSSPVSAYDAAGYGMVKLPSGKGLIVAACYDFKLRAYDITASNPNVPFWTSNVDYGSDYGDWAVNVSFADFNHDGHPEVYVRNKIYNAETGVLLAEVTGTGNTGSSYCHWTHFTNYKLSVPLAADVCNDSRLELILGNEIYGVNITNLEGTSGNTVSLVSQTTPPNGTPTDGNVQVADFNADGYLDVLISIRNTAYYSGTVYCYVWDVHNNTVSVPLTINTSWSGKSIPMIADIDNDGLMEILIQCGVSGTNERFQAYKYQSNIQTFSFLWGFATDEDSYSNSITSFDFNQDGLLELMICDQSTVRIVNGSGYSHITGNDTVPVYVMSSFPFSETTIMQYPIIVDVDDDGHAEIVSVGSDKLNVFESSASPWAPARKVWNQYMYNVTNVNQDLTVPQYLFNNATPFTDPQGVVRRPFNNFLQQATTIDQYGRPFYAVPDVAALSATLTTGGGNATLNVNYTNQGDNTLNAPYYITIFANQLGGQVVQTVTVNTPLPVGGTGQQGITVPMSALCQLENVTSLVVAINCNGGGIAQEGNLQPECDITNNTATANIDLQSEPTTVSETACDQFVWNGTTYSQSGQYEQTLTNSYGCDSLVILNLTIHLSDTVSYNVNACESYEWHGQTYSQSGDYTHNTTNEYGCDRLELLHLTLNSSYRQEDEVVECDSYLWPVNQQWYYQSALDSLVVQGQQGECDSTFVLNLTLHYSDTLALDPVTACEAYEWHGTTYTESGLLTYPTTNEYGCDRIETLELTVSGNETIELDSVAECDEYFWHGQLYTESGIYTFDTLNPYGCTLQYILPLTINHSSVNEFNVTSCESYEWFGVVYDEPGTYTHTLTNAQGCDSLLIMHLDIGETFMMEESAVGCDEYEWHGTTYSQSGDYQHEIQSPGVCDSIFILHLTIAPTYEREIEAEACYSYVWVNEALTQSGDYERHFSSVMGCDSLVTLHLTINEAVHHEFGQQTCTPFVWNGVTYYEDGDYEQTFVAANGCDSIVTMHLAFNEQFNTDIVASTCDDVYTWNGVDYFSTGVYQQSFLSAAGCDSIVNLHLTFVDTFVVSIDTASCEPLLWEDELLTASGTYQHQYVASSGCDSIVNLSFSLMDKYEIDDETTSCAPIQWGSEWLAESGYYQQQFQASTGCDSIVRLQFHLVDSYEVEIDTTVCESYQFGNELLTESGLYQYQFLASSGCDSIVKLQLTIAPILESSIQGATMIHPSTDLISGVYPYYIDSTGINPARVRWSIDRDDWPLVAHGASCDLVCTSIGQGRLRAWTDNEPCNIDTTLVVNATFFDVGEYAAPTFAVYPNPTEGKVTVEGQDIIGIKVYDAQGQLLSDSKFEKESRCVIDMKGFPSGVYVLEIMTPAGSVHRNVVVTRR